MSPLVDHYSQSRKTFEVKILLGVDIDWSDAEVLVSD